MVSIGPFSSSLQQNSSVLERETFNLDKGLSPDRAGGSPVLAQAAGELPLGDLAGGIWQLFSAAAQGIGWLTGHALNVGARLVGMLLSTPTADAQDLLDTIRELEAQGLDINSAITMSELPDGRMGIYAIRNTDEQFPDLIGILGRDGSIATGASTATVDDAGRVRAGPQEGRREDIEAEPQRRATVPGVTTPPPQQRQDMEYPSTATPGGSSPTNPDHTGRPSGEGPDFDPNSAGGMPVGGSESGLPEWPQSLDRPPAGTEMSPEAQAQVDKLNAAREQLRQERAERQEDIDGLGNEIAEMEAARRQILENGRADQEARDILRQLQEAIAGGGLGTALGGRLNDAGQIGELAETVSEEVERLRADGRENVALALLERLFDRYGEVLQQGVGQAGSGQGSALTQENFSTEAARIFNEMDLSEISQRIDPDVLALLQNPQEAIRGYTSDPSPAFQRIADALLPGLLESEEDLARFIVSENFVNPVSGLKNANALPLVAKEGHHLIVAEFGGGKSVNELLSHKHGDDLIAAGMAEIARVVTEAGGEVLHPNGATAVIVLPPGGVEDTLARLDEVFRDLAIGTADLAEGGKVFRPGIAWFDTGPIGDTSTEGLEAQFALGRREIDAVKAERVEQGLYPARGARENELFQTYDRNIHRDVRLLEGFAEVPTTGYRHAQNQVLRDGFSDLRDQIADMNPYQQAQLALQALDKDTMQATGVVSGEIQAPRDADGRVPEGYVHVQGDMSKLSVLNNQLSWDVGDAAIGHLNAAIQAAAAAYPDITFRKYGGDEWEAIGPRESAEAAVAMIRQYLADVTISFPNPNNPAETWTLHGLGVQIGILDIERDSPTGRASPEALEHNMGEDKLLQGYTLDIHDQYGNPVQP
ncbi:MAG: hypothetical protein JJU21_12715 [Salinarimonas sp.]|nr:hypothetical protein [Salinarimonas sp.]